MDNNDRIERAFRDLAHVIRQPLTRTEIESIKMFAEQLLGSVDRALAKGPVKDG